MVMSQNLDVISGEAGSGGAVSIYRFVVLNSSGQYDQNTGTSTEADGVSCEAQATAGGALAVATLKPGSILKIECNATLAIGAVISSDSSGKAIAASATVGKYRLGKMVKACVAGDIGLFLVFKERVEA